MGLFSNYLAAIAAAVRENNGATLKELLDVNNRDARTAIFERSRDRYEWNPQQDVRNGLRSLHDPNGSWQEIVTSHCRTLACLDKGRSEEAYVNLEASVLPFTKEFREDKEAWLVAPLEGLAHNIRAVALAADAESRKAGRKTSTLENCGSSLQRVFASAITGNNMRKKVAVLEIVVTLFRIYFRLNTLRLCKNLIAAVEKLSFDIFPASSRVKYKFFVGRLSIFDDQYEAAEEALEYSLRHCHRAAVHNKSRILYFLVPVKMLLGQLPTQTALQKYHLEEYADIVEAMRTGCVSKLDTSLEAQQWHFIRAGTYLVLEKLKQAVLRRLLKRVVLLHAQRSPDRANQLPLAQMQLALKWQGVAVEMKEVECLVGNLIYRGYVKGYLSHTKKMLVLSRLNAFPHLKTVTLETWF